MPDTALYRKIKLLIMARLVIASLVMAAGAVFFEINRGVFYVLIALTYAATIGYALWLKTAHRLYAQAFVQILADLILETIIIHLTGGLESAFSLLYIFSIFTAAILLTPRATLSVACLAAFFQVVATCLEVLGFIPVYSAGLGLYASALTVFYLVYVRITVLCLVGFLAARLAGRISQMEEAVRRNEKLSAMGEMAANIAHEIRNPLASIVGSIELLKEGVKVNDETRRLMNLIIKESDRLQEFLDGYLDFARSRPMQRERCDLVSVLNDVIAVVRTNNESRPQIQIGWQEGSLDCLEAYVDPVQMKQLFVNLLVNGVQAMPQGGRLAVRLEEDERVVTVHVQDQGTGIPKDRLKRLFEPFTTTKGNGTGLGLAIAHRIVEAHGGALKVKSAPGKGTTFSVILPKQKAEARHDAA